MVRIIQFIAGILLLLALEILRVYFISPFPGSQHSEAVDIAYFLHQNTFWIRTVGLLVIFFPVIHYYWLGSKLSKVLVTLALIAYVYIFVVTNFQMKADTIFLQPGVKAFAKDTSNVIRGEQLVVGVASNGKAKAYPIEIIGYHHQVQDTVGNEPVMITYCIVCRTARVFSPLVNQKPERFRLVGMDQFNAMFEDETTGSWWRQVTGEAVAGPMKGSFLREIPSQQMSLRSWLDLYPDSEIMQPDTMFNKYYKGLEKFDEGKVKSPMLRRDSLSWKDKSWIVGVQVGAAARAYDWNDLLSSHAVNDTLAGTPILVGVSYDSLSFGAWNRDSLLFSFDPASKMLVDSQTRSTWNFHGRCVEGRLAGAQLPRVQACLEFWHSWRVFRKNATQYRSSLSKAL
ncbi:MAG TPA: DUF3179 domain-containing (seleno)protein [Chryseosolibacter sp.]|nr:DUF3179 domain-containing (seleno)protein [Chryseosolibacter sp.]